MAPSHPLPSLPEPAPSRLHAALAEIQAELGALRAQLDSTAPPLNMPTLELSAALASLESRVRATLAEFPEDKTYVLRTGAAHPTMPPQYSVASAFCVPHRIGVHITLGEDAWTAMVAAAATREKGGDVASADDAPDVVDPISLVNCASGAVARLLASLVGEEGVAAAMAAKLATLSEKVRAMQEPGTSTGPSTPTVH